MDPDLQIRGPGLQKKKFGPSVWSKNKWGVGRGGRGARGTHGLDVNESSARLSVARHHILLNKQVIVYSPHHILQISGQCCTLSTDSLQREKTITNYDWWKADYLSLEELLNSNN